jgi:RNA-dependent RNA polymerase
MIKFLSSDTGLHIANKFDHPLALYLNRCAILMTVPRSSKLSCRPLIAILEHLGVATDWFLRLQTKALTEERETLLSISDDAADFLNTRHLGRPYGFGQIMRGLTKYGIKRADLEDAPHPMLDFFLRSLSVTTVHVDRELKYRARIPVPVAWSLVGVADVHEELDEWCVYSTSFYQILGFWAKGN